MRCNGTCVDGKRCRNQCSRKYCYLHSKSPRKMRFRMDGLTSSMGRMGMQDVDPFDDLSSRMGKVSINTGITMHYKNKGDPTIYSKPYPYHHFPVLRSVYKNNPDFEKVWFTRQ